MALTNNTALLIVDAQQGFDDPRWGARNNPDAEQHIVELLHAWRRTHRPIIHVQHMSVEPDSPLRPDRPGNAFKPEVLPQPGEPIFHKRVNSAFIGTELEAFLYSMRHRSEPLANGRAGYEALRIVEACYESSQRGKRIEIDWKES